MSFFLYTESRTVITRNQRVKINKLFSSFSKERIHHPPFKVQSYCHGILGSLQQTDPIVHDTGEAVFGLTYGHSQGKKDGNYIILSPSDQGLKLYTDVISSFTLWYYMDQHLFIASTSQRAIIKYIGSFELNQKVIPWILSTGNLGPEISWDRRIKKAKPDSILHFNRHKWSIHESYSEPNYSEKEERSDNEWLSLLISGFDHTHREAAKIYTDEWFLPLSGGYDSRGWLFRSSLCHPFRPYCASRFGDHCAILGR